MSITFSQYGIGNGALDVNMSNSNAFHMADSFMGLGQDEFDYCGILEGERLKTVVAQMRTRLLIARFTSHPESYLVVRGEQLLALFENAVACNRVIAWC